MIENRLKINSDDKNFRGFLRVMFPHFTKPKLLNQVTRTILQTICKSLY